jgi:serine/threonine-protein kinase
LTGSDYLRVSLNPALAVVLAYFASRVVYGLNIDVVRARRMGSYHIVEQLGRGGMGEVWKAEHAMLARPAAIKFIPPEMLASSEKESPDVGLRRFEKEAQATASLRSPHTIDLYDFGRADDGTFYYVMELLDGLDLEALVESYGPVPSERAIHLLRQVCRSLAEAHETGLIHRDIKPANIFVCRYGLESDFVKVLDFGLVKSQRDANQADLKLTSRNVVGGTPTFMAPEQALGRQDVDSRADLYSLGCVAYWLLTGRMVFEAETALEIITHHLRSAPAPPSMYAETAVPEDLDQLVLRCLEKAPENRPASAVALEQHLAAIELPDHWTQERASRWWDVHQPVGRLGPE